MLPDILHRTHPEFLAETFADMGQVPKNQRIGHFRDIHHFLDQQLRSSFESVWRAVWKGGKSWRGKWEFKVAYS